MNKKQAEDLFAEVLSYVKSIEPNKNKWYAGITFDPQKRKKDHQLITNVEYYKFWNLETKENAMGFENALHKNGFKKGKADLVQKTLEGLRPDSTFVYVFLNE